MGGGGLSLGFHKTKNESETVAVINAPAVIVAQAGTVSVSAADDINIAGKVGAGGVAPDRTFGTLPVGQASLS